MFGVTTADAVYCTLGLLAAWPLARPSRRARLLGAVLLVVASLFAWSLLAVGAWAAILAWRRHGLRSAIELSVICGVVLRRAARRLQRAHGLRPDRHGARDGGGLPARRRLGAAVLVLAARLPGRVPARARACRSRGSALRELARGTPEAVAIFSVLAISAVMGFTKAETERIWLFFAPFVCLAAARALARRPELVLPVAAALAAQALLHELLSDTVW